MYNSSLSNASKILSELRPLVENLLLLLSDKEKTVIVKRFNLDGKRRYTLEEIGQEFSVTRERIRQIEKNALSKMRRNVFNTSLKFLHEFVGEALRENGGFMKENDLHSELQSAISPDDEIDCNCVHLALFLHEEIDCIGNTINFYPYARERAISDYSLKHASNNLINQLHKYGDVRKLEKLNDDLSDVFSNINFDSKKVKSLISIDKRLTLLDGDLVGLMEWRHIHPRTLRDKILYVLRNNKQSMHFSDIADRIKEKNFDNRSVNIQAVHNELIRHDQFVLIGRGIYALAEWGYEKGTVSEVISAILKGKKELAQDEIIKLVLEKRQVKKITILLALKNNSEFERVGRKRYRLKS